MEPIDTSKWHNTGSNGTWHQVWIRTIGEHTAEIALSPTRCQLSLWHHRGRVVDRLEFSTMDKARTYADEHLANPGMHHSAVENAIAAKNLR